MAQKQKATGIITLSAVSTKICCPLFCPLFKKYLLFMIRNRAAHRYISRTQTQSNKFLNFVCLFVIKMSSLSDFCRENNKNGRFQTNMAN